MEEDFLNNELIERFENMLEENDKYYFDSEEFSEIIAYYLDVGDLPFAYKALQYALELHPNNLETKVKLLEYYIELEMLKEASVLVEELKEVAFNHFDFLICQARYWSIKNQKKLAINYYKKALEYDQEKDYVHNCLGGEYLDINEINQALFHFKRALELNLEDDFAFYSCIQCFDQIHKHQECIEFLNDYIDLMPYSEQAWFQLGLQYLSLKNYDEALRAFDYSSIVNPKSIAAFMQMAYCHEKLKQYQKAISVYEEALEFDDSASFTYLKMGQCYLKLSQNMLALKSFHQSIHEDPQLDKPWSEAAALYDSLGNYEEAIHYLNRAIELDSMNVGYHKRMAFLHIQQGKYEEAELNYEKIIQLEPAHLLNWLGYSELLIMLGEYKKGIEKLQIAVKRFERAELYYQLSCCYFLVNENDLGIKNLNIAKKLNGNLLEEMFAKYPVLKLKSSESSPKLVAKKNSKK